MTHTRPRATKALSIVAVMDDLFTGVFRGPSWRAWRVALRAAFALPPSGDDLIIFRRCTGRPTWPTRPARAIWFIIGRRGGKSRIAAFIGVFLACFRRYVLAAGERGVVVLMAGDRKQARVLFRYLSALIDQVPMLAALVASRTAEAINLTNGITIEVHAASFRSIRGYTVAAAILDEVAFWPTDDAANPDTEILNALRPAMATMPDSLLVGISSPYARRGELWRAWLAHFGKDDDPVLVWQADSRTMNPMLPANVVDAAYQDDPSVAAAEYGAEFRKDLETFISRDALDHATIPGRHELPPVSGVRYVAFVDPSGGSNDSMTAAVAHRENDGRVVVDVIREVRPPFSPEQVVADFAVLLRSYRVSVVTGDRYAGEWTREPFRKLGIAYDLSDRPKSDLYRDLLPLVNSGRVELLDHQRLLAQLGALERRTGRGGRDAIDHAPGQHDDIANAVAGAVIAANGQAGTSTGMPVLVGPRRSPTFSDRGGGGWLRDWSDARTSF